MFKTGISSGREEFAHDILKGFVSVKSGFLSNKQEYLYLFNIHISKDLTRGDLEILFSNKNI